MSRVVKLSNNKKRKLKALVAEAYAAFNQQNMNVCGQLCGEIEKLQADNPDVANLRGITAFYSNDLEKAGKYFEEAVKASPKRVDLRLTLAQFYSQQKHNALALEHYREAYSLDANKMDAILGYGQHLYLDSQYAQAVKVLQRAKKKMPEHAIVCLAIARAYFHYGDIEKAKENLSIILNKEPKHADALLSLARISLQEGDFKKTEEQCLQALESKPTLVDAYALLCDTKTFQDAEDSTIVAMKKLLGELPEHLIDFTILSTALAKALDGLGHCDEAFNIIKKAKDVHCKNNPYDAESELGHMQMIIESFTAEAFADVNELSDATPIFIVGMPRCGSTLVEQILASHPDVKSGGENSYFEVSIGDVEHEASSLTMTQMLDKPTQWWNDVAEEYLKKIRLLNPEVRHITDKTLDNIRYIGFIHKAFPKAKIIHVQRDAMDTCWSIYKNNLAGGVFRYGNDLSQLGYYYRAYERLMQCWKSILPEGVMYALSYEDLVEHQQVETEKLLSFCGLPYHDDCLNFHQLRNVSLTTSHSQVRKPIYRDSVQVWRAYEQHLQPLMKILHR